MSQVRKQAARAPRTKESAANVSHHERSGDSLPATTRSAVEPRFHHDFSQVRIHNDAPASAAAEALAADAFTLGEDIFFREGVYAPETPEGAGLLAHELAHVVQNASAPTDLSGVSAESDAAESDAWQAAGAFMSGGEVSVQAPASSAIARSPFGDINTFLGFPGKVLGGIPDLKGPLGALSPITSTLGALGGVDKMLNADDTAGAVSGGLGTASGILGLSKWMAGTESHAGVLGGVGGLLGAAGSAIDAYSNFDEGNYGKGTLDTLKATSGTLSGLASLGGFSLSSVGGMGAGAALTGGGGSGLAALGPAGAVLGSGLAGYGVGTYLSENTSVGDHSVDVLGGLDSMLSDDGEGSWALNTSESMESNWDEGNYLSAIGDGAKLAGFATVGALGGLGGGIVDAGSAAVDAVGDAGGWVADNLNPLDWF
jgi:hypothetical protein